MKLNNNLSENIKSSYFNLQFLIFLLMIWDVVLKTCTPIKRIGNYGFSLAKFSLNGSKLFTADLSTTFRIWNTNDFTFEKWSNLKSICNNACWSVDERILLYSCQNSSLLYSIEFLDNKKQETKILCDLASVILGNRESSGRTISYSVGGEINDMSWDTNSERLAISFKNSNNDSNLNAVAIFITKIYPSIEITPCGLVQGPHNTWPTSVHFKPEFDNGSLLAIAWSNGRIQYIPLYYSKLAQRADERIYRQTQKLEEAIYKRL